MKIIFTSAIVLDDSNLFLVLLTGCVYGFIYCFKKGYTMNQHSKQDFLRGAKYILIALLFTLILAVAIYAKFC